jgi:Photosynthetic reaction centre cytochrome C subunit
VTTSTLKGLTPSDFLGAMGVMTAAVGYDCSNCHPGAGTDKFDWVIDSIPQKKTARKMVEMVAAINRSNFSGAQQVTCWTCHHGLDLPTTSIALDKLYGEPNDEKRDVVVPAQGMPPATQILDQYIQAIGGAQKLSGLKSFIATGHSEGYAGLGGNAAFQIFAQSPDSRGMWINFPDHPDRGISAWTYDGKAGWISQPRSLLGVWELTCKLRLAHAFSVFWAFSIVRQRAPSGRLRSAVSVRFRAAAGWLHTVDEFSIRLKLESCGPKEFAPKGRRHTRSL